MPVYWVINYTDTHIVDEDLMSIIAQGGWWAERSGMGIVCRAVNDSPSLVDFHVAYKKK